MIIIGEKINGAIPSVKAAIAARDADLIRQRAIAQDLAGAHYIDCAPSTATELEYDAMVWLIGEILYFPLAAPQDMQDLSSLTGIKPVPPAVEAQS